MLFRSQPSVSTSVSTSAQHRAQDVLARERALGLCYEGEVRELAPEAVLANLPVAPDDYAVRLLEGVDAHRSEIDAHLTEYSEHWTLDRMPVVDRCILRIAAYELAYEPEVPTAVAAALFDRFEEQGDLLRAHPLDSAQAPGCCGGCCWPCCWPSPAWGCWCPPPAVGCGGPP